MSKDKKGGLDVSLDVDVAKGKVGAGVSVPTSLVRQWQAFKDPERFVRAEMAQNIGKKLLSGEQLTPEERILTLASNEEQIRRTANLASIYNRALQQAPELPQLIEEPSHVPALPPASQEQPKAPVPPPDTQVYWWERFRADAEVVSVEYMQELYAKLLVGQVRKPGTFSLKTLEVVRCLDEDMAARFHKMRGLFIPALGILDLSDLTPKFAFASILTLAEAGLVDSSAIIWRAHGGGGTKVRYQKWWIRCDVLADVEFDVYPLTRAGRELLGVLQADERRLDLICRALTRQMEDQGSSGAVEVSSHKNGPFERWVDPNPPDSDGVPQV